MYKTWILIILLVTALFTSSGYTETEKKGKSWKGSVTEADLVAVVNFLMNNKGKDIDLAGEKHRITGKELLDVKISVLSCCAEEDIHKYISGSGVVKDVEFPIFHASVPADAIPKIDKHGEITDIKFESKARKLWMRAIGEKR